MPLVLESLPQSRFLDLHRRNRKSAGSNSHFSSYVVARKCAALLDCKSPLGKRTTTLPPSALTQCFSSAIATTTTPSTYSTPNCSNTSTEYFNRNSSCISFSKAALFNETLHQVNSSYNSKTDMLCSPPCSDSPIFQAGITQLSQKASTPNKLQGSSTHVLLSPLTEQLNSKTSHASYGKFLVSMSDQTHSPHEPYASSTSLAEASCTTDFGGQLPIPHDHFFSAQPTSHHGCPPPTIHTPPFFGEQNNLCHPQGHVHVQASRHELHDQDFPLPNKEHHSLPPLPVFKLLNTAVWKGSLIGQGFSSSVHRGFGIELSQCEGHVQKSEPIALKISQKVMDFTKHTKLSTLTREFEVLKVLYKQKVPVPRPISFAMYTDTKGSVQTVLTMDLIQGLTLRDWINAQTDGAVHHKTIGRTVHPCMTLDNAIDRLDIALSLVEALQKLHKFGVFVDLKPRNIMITPSSQTKTSNYGTQTSDQEVTRGERFRSPRWMVTLVDMGGIVLRKELDSNETTSIQSFNASHLPTLENSPESTLVGLEPPVQSSSPSDSLPHENCRSTPNCFSCLMSTSPVEQDIEVIPSLHRQCKDEKHLMNIHLLVLRRSCDPLETTCSYISPEVSAAIVEHDFLKNNFLRHFKPCVKEFSLKMDHRYPTEMSSILRNAFERLAMYLSQMGIFHPINKIPQDGGNGSEEKEKELHGSVFLGQSSSIFSLGLILVELFGGLRTGLTGLCNFPVISNWFSEFSENKSTPEDCEFRVALEWNIPQLPRTPSVSPENHHLIHDMSALDYNNPSRVNLSPTLKNPMSVKPQCTKFGPHPNLNRMTEYRSFYDVFKEYCYPKQGILAHCSDYPKTAKFETLEERFLGFERQYKEMMRERLRLVSSVSLECMQQSRTEKVSPEYKALVQRHIILAQEIQALTRAIVEFILDGCLEFSPGKRVSYETLYKTLKMLRQIILAMG